MNRTEANRIAEIITNEQLKEMFDNAKGQITDWTKVSLVNKGMSKGAAWNILGKDFTVDYNYSIWAKSNMIREFGFYLPESLKPKKVLHFANAPSIIHQEPIFN